MAFLDGSATEQYPQRLGATVVGSAGSEGGWFCLPFRVPVRFENGAIWAWKPASPATEIRSAVLPVAVERP